MAGAKRRPNRNFGGRRFNAGVIPAKIKSGPHLRAPNNAVPYSYSNPSPDDPSRPIHLASSSIVAFVDPSPSSDVNAPVPSYNYDPAFAGGLGLGFQNDEAESEDEELEEEEEEEEEEGERGEGFISIGGVRVYTEDTSSPEDDDASGSGNEDSTGSEGESSDGSSDSDDDDDDDDEGSEIDEEMAEDYLDGIGGSGELMNSKWMSKRNLEEEFVDFDASSSDDGEDGGKLGAIDLMNESREYGMLRKEKKKKKNSEVKTRREKVEVRLSAAMDDLMFEKDARMVSGRRNKNKNKKDLSQLSKSWPRSGGRSRDYYGVPGLYLSI